MTRSLHVASLLLLTASVLAVSAKPPAAPKEDTKKLTAPTATPTPITDSTAESTLARWLVQADGLVLPFAQVVEASTGKKESPFDAANPGDAAFLSKTSAALDRIMPQMNRSDSPARSAAGPNRFDLVASFFEAELRAAWQIPADPAQERPLSPLYPAVRVTDAATGKSYVLSVVLFSTGDAAGAHVPNFEPGTNAGRIPSEASCLLVGIEHNGKEGHEVAFLNWQILDLAKLNVRFTPVFRTLGKEALPAGAVLTDGRKGRD